ncbi:MAG: hypothetical protein F4Y78_07340 [Candidatus Dadabacteria bacterium]|nr:hypothetical protein [Candidatus Dadabacteria bacterium]MYA48091.1 hypothetical protein [Candidatus Dadabacteria bacterium]MYF48083.1 hypothetical protein [Candidatus Dadabacteria bacterium]MYG83452.1 hypothetical protein [Candidatus Dadabacteria bacterium]MYK49603.1 hypothetical protein [Candidatus Dadabacteria bacterium]
MLKFIKKEDENLDYPLDIFDEEDEFADEFDELFEEVNYLYYDDDSEEIPGDEKERRVLH